MKIAIMIMAADKEPSLRNIQAIKDTFIDYACKLMSDGNLKHEYDFWFYTYNSDDVVEKYPNGIEKIRDHVKYLHILGKESIYNTFEKTIYTYNFLTGYSNNTYDWYIRINVSTYLNILLLDRAIDIFNGHPEKIYCNVVNSYIWDCTPDSTMLGEYYNDLYPRGDFVCVSRNVKDDIIETCDKYIRCDVSDSGRINCPHVDDVLIGLCIIDAFGKDYYNHLQMLTYNYMPQESVDFSAFRDFAVCSRIKTLTRGCNVWFDTAERKHDIDKFHILYEYYNTHKIDKYCDYTEDEIINRVFQQMSTRNNLTVMVTTTNTQNIVDFLKIKRG